MSLPIVGTVKTMGDEEGFMVVDADLGLLSIAEECYGVRKDLGTAGWHYSR